MKKFLAVVLCVVLVFVLVFVAHCANAERPLTVNELLELAERYLLEGNYERALIYFERVIEIDPTNPRGYTGAADAYVGLGRIDDAIDILRQGLVTLPGNQEILDALAALEGIASGPVAQGPETPIVQEITPPPIPTTEQPPSDDESGVEPAIPPTPPTPLVPPTPPEPPDYIMIRGIQINKNLTELHICLCSISVISMPSQLTTADFEPLRYMTNLTLLCMEGSPISDLSPLAGLTNLGYLVLGSNQISDISPLAGLTNLNILGLLNNQINDISPLADLTNLNVLHLGNNQINDISPLASSTNLRFLHLGNNQISDISPLAGLTNLDYLNLQNNQISDISSLAGLIELNILNLQNNQISDISPLAGLAPNTHLNLSNNPIADWSPLDHIIDVIGRPELPITGLLSEWDYTLEDDLEGVLADTAEDIHKSKPDDASYNTPDGAPDSKPEDESDNMPDITPEDAPKVMEQIAKCTNITTVSYICSERT